MFTHMDDVIYYDLLYCPSSWEIFDMQPTQSELLKRSLEFEEFVTRKWPEYSETMRFVILQSRNRVIKDLQKKQIEEFDRCL